mmetsp:Transcript_24568/g.79414  ORF Transcript_24568/g.79414 Transcript_24568/m.79414 type:complete len:501 (+) Transcript_24568:54-1556(+)
MKVAGVLGLMALALVGGLASAELAFEARMEGSLEPFALSENARYAGQKVSATKEGMVFEEANHFYGVGAAVSPPFQGAEALAVQFEVELTEGLTCGGAYVKLLEESSSSFDDKSPFVAMFGPDKCGATDKVHFILRSQNPVSKEWSEHHLTKAPKVASSSKKPHLYGAVLSSKKDGKLEIFVDGESSYSGSIFEDMEPPLEPPQEIDDPEDSKPADWVDEAQIDDPDASKPDDWDEDAPRKIADPDASKPEGWLDDAPAVVPDPEASKPEDWDDDEDGDWEAPEIDNPDCKAVGCGEWKPPQIDNPAYKGKWHAPKVENPAYKGPWAPRKITNPNYFQVTTFEPKPVAAVVVDIWTTNAGITYKNFALGSSLDELTAFAAPFYERKAKDDEDELKKKEDKKQKKLAKKQQKQILTRLQLIADDLLEAAKDKPQAAVGSAVVVLLTLVYLLFFSGGSKKSASATKNDDDDATPEGDSPPKEDDQADDDDGEEERSKPPMAD